MNDLGNGRNSQVVVVTGASSGIGKETALRYASRHARIALASRSAESLEPVAEACRAAGAAEVMVQATDISDAEQVQSLFDNAIARFGRIDVATQCAAITAFGRFEDLPVDVFDGIVRTNVLGAANVARSALVHFQATGSGHLVLVGSLLGVTAVPYQSAYVVSKFALRGLVRLLRQENVQFPGIKVHGVYPGPVDTPVYSTAGNYFGRAPRVAPTAVSPGTIVGAIVRATERKRSSERQVGWMNRPAIIVYHALPSFFDMVIGPFLRAIAFSSGPVESTPGNVFSPPSGTPRDDADEAARPAG